MKLLYSPGTCSLAPHLVLEEIGEPYEIEFVSNRDGSTRTEAFLKINPKGQIPVLMDGDSLITEVPAILFYLAAKHPNSNLMPNDPFRMSRMIEWMNWLAVTQATAISGYYRPDKYSKIKERHAEIVDNSLIKAHEQYILFDQKLRDGLWVAESFSIVDPYLMVLFRWGNMIGIDMSKFSNLTRHAHAMEARDATKTVLRKEDISIWG
ncbi:glutathione S-transferase family protein [Roseovarius sp. EL26]|uniref:glutathione S-transferase family protein n=1 Tax=Roseovarius sp. EL26 TaxID=2126672 RepID=UPI000EA3A9C0|nr:glutathione S-transferase N-terminal domain-containing protein [Roseovarius sp. EL26]